MKDWLPQKFFIVPSVGLADALIERGLRDENIVQRGVSADSIYAMNDAAVYMGRMGTGGRTSVKEGTQSSLRSGQARSTIRQGLHKLGGFFQRLGERFIASNPSAASGKAAQQSGNTTGSSAQSKQSSPSSQSNPPVTQSMLEARYGKGNVQRGGENSLATREHVHNNVQSNRAGNDQAQSGRIGQMAWELQKGRLPGTPLGTLGTPRTMPASRNPNASANKFAQTLLGRRPNTHEYQAGAGMNNNDCAGCWRATLPDGSTVVYRLAGKASAATNPTTASVEIHNSPRLKAMNNGNDLKFKFPER